MTTLGVLQDDWVRRCEAAAIPQAAYDVVEIISIVLNIMPEDVALNPARVLDDIQRATIEQAIQARLQRIPVPRIFGVMDFAGLKISVRDGVCRPYPEGISFVDHVEMQLKAHDRPLRILDLGTGTGCLLLALLKSVPAATGVGIDIDPAIINLARENAATNGLADRANFELCDWGSNIKEQFDVIIANPPRVATDDVPRLLPEMRLHDPVVALDGGADGLACVRRAEECFARLAKPDALGAFQVGPRYAAEVMGFFQDRGYADVALRLNYLGQPVAVIFTNRKRAVSGFGRIKRWLSAN